MTGGGGGGADGREGAKSGKDGAGKAGKVAKDGGAAADSDPDGEASGVTSLEEDEEEEEEGLLANLARDPEVREERWGCMRDA